MKNACLDHCHTTGNIRAVLCRNCNSMEGKAKNVATRAKRGGTAILWLTRLLEYWQEHTDNPTGVFHPTHKTDAEKRVIRNAKAKVARASKKAREASK